MDGGQTAKVGGSANQKRLCGSGAKGDVVRSQHSESEGCTLRLAAGFLKIGISLNHPIYFLGFSMK